MNEGIIYLAETDSQPEMFKIGITSGDNAEAVASRMKDLFSTGLALPLSAFKASIVHDYDKLEKELHNAADNWRVHPRREYFWDECRSMIELFLEKYEISDVTPIEEFEDDAESFAVTNAENRRARGETKNLADVYDYGHTFSFVKYPQEQAVFVEADFANAFKWNGVVKSYSGVAFDILKKYGRVSDHGVAGARYWKDESEILIEKRFAANQSMVQ